MIQNIRRTTKAEFRQFITADDVSHPSSTGILPAAFVFYPRIDYPALRHLIWRWAAEKLATLTQVLVCSDYAIVASTVREHLEIM